jgi:hypothetical protein
MIGLLAIRITGPGRAGETGPLLQRLRAAAHAVKA